MYIKSINDPWTSISPCYVLRHKFPILKKGVSLGEVTYIGLQSNVKNIKTGRGYTNSLVETFVNVWSGETSSARTKFFYFKKHVKKRIY